MVMAANTIPDMAVPFFYLAQEPFWKLVPQPEATSQPETTLSLAQLKNTAWAPATTRQTMG